MLVAFQHLKKKFRGVKWLEMANSKKQNEMNFEEKLWETAEQLRGKVEDLATNTLP